MASTRGVPKGSSFVWVAKSALLDLSHKLESGIPFGSFSPAVYDTAWLARISTRGSEPVWLFPQCLQYLIKTQSELGGWPTEGSETDDILNTLAAIMAFKDHQTSTSVVRKTPAVDLSARLVKAEKYLEKILGQWDVSSTMHVGFEIIVPSMIEALEETGTRLHFPGRQALMSLYRQKMSSVLDVLYTSRKTTLLHSLEAFVGKVDFDRLAHHIDEHGSIMASPAATAAYLMCSSNWDEKAEQYLRHVLVYGSGQGSGGIPSAFPTATFETTWIVSTLFKTTIAPILLEQECINTIRRYLQSQLDSSQGVIGWDSSVLADADDTAKAILSLHLLGAPASPAAMIDEFEVNKHFQTYKYERNASLSTNCNVLDALLHTSNPKQYTSQIIALAEFICEAYFAGSIRDKWNTSEYYSTMLVSQVLVLFLQAWDSGVLQDLPGNLIDYQIPIILFQIPIRTLQAQWPDGSWHNEKCRSTSPSREITAYSVLSLKAVQSLPWVINFLPKIQQAIEKGRAYIESHMNFNIHEPIWIEKVTYALPPVAQAYCIAALCPNTSDVWNKGALRITGIEVREVRNLAKFFSKLPLFSNDEIWTLEADVTLGYLYRRKLLHASSLIFPQRHSVAYYKYLEYIPFTWISTNRKNHYPLSNNLIWETMMIAVLDYQLDEFMETAFDDKEQAGNIEAVRLLVRELCILDPGTPARGSPPSPTQSSTYMSRLKLHDRIDDNSGIFPKDLHSGNTNSDNKKHSSSNPEHIKSVLRNFTSYIFQHACVVGTPFYVQKNLHDELAACILAHIDHEEDNIRFAAQQRSRVSYGSSSNATGIRILESPRGTYYSWVTTTGADNTHAPFTFQFFGCLAASVLGKPLFCGARQHYLSSATSRHLANLCRQYNDYGSVARDEAEKNINSLNFPEFHETGTDDEAAASPGRHNETVMKQDLYFIAQYERRCLDHAMQALDAELRSTHRGEWKIRALKVFVDTVDLYGQMYVARDITPRVK